MSTNNAPALIDPPAMHALPVEARAIVGQVMLAIREENRKNLESIKLELRAVVNDNGVLRENLSRLNDAIGQFREREAMPLRDALQDFNTNAASRVAENQAKLEILIQAFAKAMKEAHIAVPQDALQAIAEGRFEEHRHAIASEVGPLREPGEPIL